MVVNEKRKWTFASEDGVERDVGCEEAAFDRHLHFAAAPVEVAEEALGKQRELRSGGRGGGMLPVVVCGGIWTSANTNNCAAFEMLAKSYNTNAVSNGTSCAAPCC